MPASNVGGRHALHKSTELCILRRPQHHVPVIRHDAVSQDSNSDPICSLNDHPLERLIVSIVFKDPTTCISAIKYVEDESAWSNSRNARHVATVFHNRPEFSRIGLIPFLLVRAR